ncbi:MAG: methionyl-tRNA formyltransferase [Rickettsiales bacterium]|nr:methionyl-tRNA formyltransferase [Rickettsiales bacterium]
MSIAAILVAGMTITNPAVTKPLRLIFMGSPEFAVPCLQSLIDSEHEVVAVYCQPPRPAGRGHKLRNTPVHEVALQHDIAVHHPASLKSNEEQQRFATYEADAAIVAAYGLLLPQAILDAPKHGCINVHPSKLPRWRGAAPLQRTIMAGDSETSLCIMQMELGLDTGPILLEQPMSITDGMTTGELHDVMAAKAGAAILLVLADEPVATVQSETGVTYASKIDKAEARIDWKKPAKEVLQQILGLSPFPGAFTELNGEKLKILNASLAEGTGNAGELLDDSLTVSCASDAIKLTKVQRAGKKPMDADELLRGFSIPKGSTFDA